MFLSAVLSTFSSIFIYPSCFMSLISVGKPLHFAFPLFSAVLSLNITLTHPCSCVVAQKVFFLFRLLVSFCTLSTSGCWTSKIMFSFKFLGVCLPKDSRTWFCVDRERERESFLRSTLQLHSFLKEPDNSCRPYTHKTVSRTFGLGGGATIECKGC